MSGETNLNTLLSTIQPRLLDDEYVFCTIPNGKYGDYALASPLASYMENEGLTLVLTKENATKVSLHYEMLFRCITLCAYSSLEAVGLTAAVSTALADKGISANVVAAYFHDHIFVHAEQAQQALVVLNDLSRKAFKF